MSAPCLNSPTPPPLFAVWVMTVFIFWKVTHSLLCVLRVPCFIVLTVILSTPVYAELPDRPGRLMPLFNDADDVDRSSVPIVLWHCRFVLMPLRCVCLGLFGCKSKSVKSVFSPPLYTEIVYVKYVYTWLFQTDETFFYSPQCQRCFGTEASWQVRTAQRRNVTNSHTNNKTKLLNDSLSS